MLATTTATINVSSDILSYPVNISKTMTMSKNGLVIGRPFSRQNHQMLHTENTIPENASKNISENTSQNASENISEKISENTSENIRKYI